MSDLEGAGMTPSFNQSSVSNQMNVSDSTQCDQVDTLAHIFFMVVYSLVFLVSLKYSDSLNSVICWHSFLKNWPELSNQILTVSVVNTVPVFFFFPLQVGLLLNGFTLKVYFCRAQQQASSSVTIYLKNLAAADFLISLCLPIRIANYASCSVSVRQVYCNFGASTFYLNMYASILFMGYIAANR